MTVAEYKNSSAEPIDNPAQADDASQQRLHAPRNSVSSIARGSIRSSHRGSVRSQRGSVASNHGGGSIVLNDSMIIELTSPTRNSVSSIVSTDVISTMKEVRDYFDDEESDDNSDDKYHGEIDELQRIKAGEKTVMLRSNVDDKKESPQVEVVDDTVDAAMVVEENGVRTVSALSPEEVELLISIRSFHKAKTEESLAFNVQEKSKAQILIQTHNILDTNQVIQKEEGELGKEEAKSHCLTDSLGSIMEQRDLEEIRRKQTGVTAKVGTKVESTLAAGMNPAQVQLRSAKTTVAADEHQKSRRRSRANGHTPGAFAIRGMEYEEGNDVVQDFADETIGTVSRDGNNSEEEADDIESQQFISTSLVSRPSDLTRTSGMEEPTGDTPIAASVVEKTVEAAVLSPEEMEELAKPGSRRRLYALLCATCCSIVAVIIGVTVSLTTRKEAIGTLSPTAVPTTSPTLTFESRIQYLQGIIINKTLPASNTTSLLMPNTPQHKAFEWLSMEEPMLEDEVRVLQRYVLALLYFATSGPSWGRYNLFLDPDHECTWMVTGITCSEDGVITELDLSDNKMDGPLPHEILALSNLVRLNLVGNKLQGSVPSFGLAKLTALKELDLRQNRFVGTIPREIEFLSSMEILRMSGNELEGTLPQGIPKLMSLTSLRFDVNDLKGTIPLGVYNMTGLVDVSLGKNRLTGSIPTEVGQLSLLTNLALFGSFITGTIPTEIGALSDVINLQLADMDLVGTIPSELGHLTQVSKLSLSYNPITGTVPRNFLNMGRLKKLYLQNTRLVGNVTFLCGEVGPLNPFRVDLGEVACNCCTCCE